MGKFVQYIKDTDNDLVYFPYYEGEYDEAPSAPAKLDRGLTAYVIRIGQSLLCDGSQFKIARQSIRMMC